MENKAFSDPVTKKIRFFFITLDEDGDLTRKFPTKKGRAIAEVDTDGSYVMNETSVEESKKVKMFDKFIEDLKKLSRKNGMTKKGLLMEWKRLDYEIFENCPRTDKPFPPAIVERRELLLFAQVHLS